MTSQLWQCSNCAGEFSYGHGQPKFCPYCRSQELRLFEDHEPAFVKTCSECSGTGTIEKTHPFPDDPDFCEVNRCEVCGGSGRIQRP